MTENVRHELLIGGVTPLEFTDEHRHYLDMMAAEALKIVGCYEEHRLKPHDYEDKDYQPIEIDGVVQLPFLAPENGWYDTEVNGGQGIRFPNPRYPGSINRNTIIHLPDTPEAINSLLPELETLGLMALQSAVRTEERLLTDLGLDTSGLSRITRIILNPGDPTVQNRDEGDNAAVALKTHTDKGEWSVTEFETGPGFEYLNDQGIWVAPETGNYLFASDQSEHPPCKHRVNHGKIDGSHPHESLDPAIKTRLAESRYARLAIVAFYA